MMNITCTMQKHLGLWSTLAIESFAPVYPTSIRGNDNQRDTRGTS